MHDVLETMTAKIDHMGVFADRWGNFNTRLGELKSWVKSAQGLLNRINVTEMNPEERMSQANKLQSQIVEKLALLSELESEAMRLIDGRSRSL